VPPTPPRPGGDAEHQDPGAKPLSRPREQGDEVVVRMVVSGTQTGPVLGIPATGRNTHWDAIDIFRLNGGKISAIWAGDDWSAVLYYTGTYTAPWIH
jgi:SnoaL-like polyketide cyclase